MTEETARVRMQLLEGEQEIRRCPSCGTWAEDVLARKGKVCMNCRHAWEYDPGDFPAFAKEVQQWQRETFPGGSGLGAARHLLEEAGELVEALEPVKEGTITAALERDREMRKEAADCLLLLIAVAGLEGFDLLEAAREKMKINRARTWETSSGEKGYRKHIEPNDFEVREIRLEVKESEPSLCPRCGGLEFNAEPHPTRCPHGISYGEPCREASDRIASEDEWLDVEEWRIIRHPDPNIRGWLLENSVGARCPTSFLSVEDARAYAEDSGWRLPMPGTKGNPATISDVSPPGGKIPNGEGPEIRVGFDFGEKPVVSGDLVPDWAGEADGLWIIRMREDGKFELVLPGGDVGDTRMGRYDSPAAARMAAASSGLKVREPDGQ